VKRSNEPIAWSLFGAGGMLLALLGPGMIIATGWLLPFAPPERAYGTLGALFAHPLGKLAVLAAISLTLFHTVHRIYHGLHDLHVKLPAPLLLILTYGAATVLTVACGSWLLLI
jgi:fumarate reductase subunit D